IKPHPVHAVATRGSTDLIALTAAGKTHQQPATDPDDAGTRESVFAFGRKPDDGRTVPLPMNAIARPGELDDVSHIGVADGWRQIGSVPHPPVLRTETKHVRVRYGVGIFGRAIENRTRRKALERVLQRLRSRESDRVVPGRAHAQIPSHVIERKAAIRLHNAADTDTAVVEGTVGARPQHRLLRHFDDTRGFRHLDIDPSDVGPLLRVARTVEETKDIASEMTGRRQRRMAARPWLGSVRSKNDAKALPGHCGLTNFSSACWAPATARCRAAPPPKNPADPPAPARRRRARIFFR